MFYLFRIGAVDQLVHGQAWGVTFVPAAPILRPVNSEAPLLLAHLSLAMVYAGVLRWLPLRHCQSFDDLVVVRAELSVGEMHL